jgi:hypothetical protein
LCEANLRDIEIRCAGLLRTNPSPAKTKISFLQPWYGKEYHDLIPYADKEIIQNPLEFVHRTARDFLTDTEGGLKIMDKNKIPEWHIRHKFAAARLACSCLFRVAPNNKYISDDVGGVRRFPTYCSNLRSHLKSILRLLDALPEGDEENAIGECDELLQFCEQLFKSGQLFADSRLPVHNEDFQKEVLESDMLRTRYEAVVKREHEFILEVASINLNLWPLICAKGQSQELDKQTLSEILLHVCNITSDHYANMLRPSMQNIKSSHYLGIDSRLKLVRLLLERGACPSRKGPQRIGRRFNTLRSSYTPFLHLSKLSLLVSGTWNVIGT